MGRKEDQMTLANIYGYFSESQKVYFATVLDEQPKLRPMTLFYYKGKFYFTTFTNDSKVAQIKSNKLCEVLMSINDEYKNDGYIKMTGTAKVCNDLDIKHDAQYFCYYFDTYYESVDDPDFCLIELSFHTYEYMKPGNDHTITVKA